MTDLFPRIEHIAVMAEHKGACEALLAACRLLRRCGHGDAAELLIENLESLVPEVEALSEVQP